MPTIPCPVESLTQSDLLDVVQRVLPPEYLGPMLPPASGAGWEVFQSQAAQEARASQGVEHLGCGLFVLTAPDGASATGSVTLSRPTATAGALTVLAGSLLAGPGGRVYTVSSSVDMGAGATSVTVPVVAAAQGYEHNLQAGLVQQVIRLDTSPVFADPTLAISSSTAMVGGVFPFLDALGADRGIARRAGESADAYRIRLRQLPDTVSPAAIDRFLESYWNTRFPAYPATMLEAWEGWQTCADAPDVSVGAYSATDALCYDDDRPEPPLRGRYLTEEEAAGAFTILLPNLPAVSDQSLCYDAPETAVATLATPAGHRAMTAYDLPDSTAVIPWQGAPDGEDPGWSGAYAAFWAALTEIKPAGVIVDFWLVG